jgi:hypothetical protein
MNNITNLSLVIVGASIRGLVESVAGDVGCQITETQCAIWQLNRLLVVLFSGWRCSLPTNRHN